MFIYVIVVLFGLIEGMLVWYCGYYTGYRAGWHEGQIRLIVEARCRTDCPPTFLKEER